MVPINNNGLKVHYYIICLYTHISIHTKLLITINKSSNKLRQNKEFLIGTYIPNMKNWKLPINDYITTQYSTTKE